MPLSMTANFSCDVNQDGGNDLSAYGPFNTIQAALNFMVAKYGAQMGPNRHGVINIGPGVYLEVITLNVTHNYIDLVGAGRKATVVQFPGGGIFGITDGGAVNHICTLAIQSTGTGGGDYALNVQANQGVLFEDCAIQGASNAIIYFGTGGRMSNCDILAEGTGSGQQLNANILGDLDNCRLEGLHAGQGSVLIGGLSGTIRNSRLSTLQPGGPEVRTVNYLSGGKLSYCALEAQGNAIYEANNGAIIEYCYLSTEGSQGSAVITRLNGCTVRDCFVHQKEDGAAVAYGPLDDAVAEVVDTTFFAPACTGSIVTNLSGNGSRWQGCRMIGSDGATVGYALEADVLDRIVVVKDLVSNRPVDPRIRLTDNGLAAKGLGEAKGYSQKRWWALHGGVASATEGVGIVASEIHPMGYGGGSDTTGMYRSMQINTGNTCSISANQKMRRIYKPKLHVKFRVDDLGTTQNARLWCGFFTMAPPSNDDNLASIGCVGMGLLYSQARPFQGAASTGVGGTGYTPTLAAAALADPHVFSMCFDDANNRVVYQMDGQSLGDVTSNLPASTDEMSFYIQLTAVSGVPNMNLIFYDAWCEFDP